MKTELKGNNLKSATVMVLCNCMKFYQNVFNGFGDSLSAASAGKTIWGRHNVAPHFINLLEI